MRANLPLGSSLPLMSPAVTIGSASLTAAGYQNNAGSSVVLTSRLAQGGLTAEEIVYGTPGMSDLPSGAPTIPTGALGDGVSMTPLASSKLNITFQPDGSVIDTTRNPDGRAMFFFNSEAIQKHAHSNFSHRHRRSKQSVEV